MFTFLREPIKRLISQFYYVHYNVNKVPNADEFVVKNDLETYIQNYETKALGGLNEQYRFLRDTKNDHNLEFDPHQICNLPRSKVPDRIASAILKDVKSLIKNYDFIGITEDYEYCMSKLKFNDFDRKLNLITQNRGIYTEVETNISSEGMAKLRDCKWIELYLYEVIRKKIHFRKKFEKLFLIH